MSDKPADLVIAVRKLREALSGVTRILEAFKYTNAFGKTQAERLDKARKVLKETEEYDA